VKRNISNDDVHTIEVEINLNMFCVDGVGGQVDRVDAIAVDESSS
jgi:hypothetical protein